ncbi:unnamed protein product [Closterium sp. NIES-53]
MAYISRCRGLRDRLLQCGGSISEEAFITVINAGLGPHWCQNIIAYTLGVPPPPLAPSYASAAAADVSVAEDVGAASASVKHRSSKGKGGRGGGDGSSGGGGGSRSGGGGSGGGGGGSGGGGGGGTVGGSGGSGGGGGGSGGSGGSGGGGTGSGGTGARRWFLRGASRGSCPYVIRTGDRAGQTCGRLHTQHRCFSRLDDAWRAEFGDDVELPRWADLLKSRIDIFDLDFDAILSSMYALSVSAEVDCYRCVPPDPGIAAAALGARESGTLPGTTPAEALHTFTLDSGASRCFFRESTTLTPLTAPVPSRLADPSRGPVVARSSTVLPCPAVPSGSLSGLHLPSFSTNLTLLWHHRLGHPSLPRLRGMHSRLLVSGLPRSLPPLPPSPAPPCLPCVEGWQRAAPHSSFPPTIAPLQTLHIDVWGPARVSGQSRECYFLLVVDDYRRYTTIFPLRSKSQVVNVLIPWIRTVRLQLRERFHQDLPVLRLHSDRGGEFSSNVLRDFCHGEDFLQLFTLPESPQQNGIAERHIGLVMEVARTSMIHAATPHFLWPFAARYAAHQLNLWPRVSLPETSPTLRWTGEVGDALVFWVWGSRAFIHDTSADKLSPRAIPCVFLGFVPDAPGWQFYHPTSRRVFPSQDVTFDESGPAPSGVSQVDPLPGPAPVQVAVNSGAARGTVSGSADPGGAESEGAKTGGANPRGVETEGAEPGGVATGGGEPGGPASSGGSAGALPRLSALQLREWFVRLTCVWSGAFGAGGAGAAGARGLGVAAGAGVTRGTMTTGPGGACTRGTGAAGTGGVEGAGAGDPTELGAAGAGGTSAGGAGAGGAGAAGVGAVNPGAGGPGDTVRPRPYFVPLLQQVLGVPTSTGLTPPLMCPPPDQTQLPLLPASPLPALSPYTEQSGGLTERCEPASHRVSPVRTGRHDTLRTTLAALGFAPSTTDPSLFLCTDTSLPPFYVLVYADDLVFATADTEALTLVKSELQKRHTCIDLSELHSYLGLQITRDRARHTITLTQSHMVHQVLQRFGFQFSSPQPTPLFTSHSLSAPPSDESVELSGPYLELVGCLMYLMTCTQPGLAYRLSLLARYMAPGMHRKVHWDAAKRVLRYLCSTSGMGLVLGGRGPVVLTGHTDVSWVDDSATQRSSQGYTFSLGSGSVSWQSTRSSSVLSSCCEAEIYAGAMAAQELRWLTYLLTDLGEQPRSPPVMYVDNKAMIALCQEHRLEHRTKHITLRYFLA